MRVDIGRYKVTGRSPIHLDDFNTHETGSFTSNQDIRKAVEKNVLEMAQWQSKLYAEGKTGLLIIFQAMDAGGKDSAIKHVMSGVNPQGVEVYSFKQPSVEELSHDYMWRSFKALPPRGKIAIFNRSYYEDVLVVKVHKLYEQLNVPDRCKDADTIDKRYKHIRHFEEYLWDNGIITVKFFLHVSKDEQRERFLSRIKEKDKNWKFTKSDLDERSFWNDYQNAYQSAVNATATKISPWYIIPADKKWYSRAVVSQVLLHVLRDIHPQYPRVTQEQRKALSKYKEWLINEPLNKQ
ncbi:MAG: polyphosphate kinase 2 family protein [Clostridia bacterium]|nr:polyphosphate kinase 2 family protein [Clostridia bacterium]